MRLFFLALFLVALAVGFLVPLDRSPDRPGRPSRLLVVVRCCALPSAFCALWVGYFVHERAVLPFGDLIVIEKYEPAPGRYTIVGRTEPNENGGTATVVKAYPLWLYETVEPGDVLVPGLFHYRV